MTGKWHGGKGSKPRPVKDKNTFDSEWDRIFKKPKDQKTKLKRQTQKTNDKV
tara:strand:- start:394 stop:549 length:156 start_codon:yes stop_codon:yes gene_type:complete